MALAEQRESPPEPTDAEYARNFRNDLRDEICQHIDSIDSRLGELEPDGYEGHLMNLAVLREELRRDYEDRPVPREAK